MKRCKWCEAKIEDDVKITVKEDIENYHFADMIHKEKKVMSNAKRCDRCGKFYVVGEKSFRIRNSKVGALKVLDVNGYYIIEMDLCDECVEKLDRFLKGEEVC